MDGIRDLVGVFGDIMAKVLAVVVFLAVVGVCAITILTLIRFYITLGTVDEYLHFMRQLIQQETQLLIR